MQMYIKAGLKDEPITFMMTDSQITDEKFLVFINKVRTNLHMILCFSPVGEAFRVRARRFPALVNNTVIDWFHPWPTEALESVADRFLDDVELGEDAVKE